MKYDRLSPQKDVGERQIKKRGLITSPMFLRYRQTPLPLKRVKAHAV